jgi:hypothetical protein
LVLEGRAPQLARYYPSAGGRPGPGAWKAFQATVEEHTVALRPLVVNPVQTNEVGRSGALLGGFLTVASEAGLPLRLLEIGASAGLNLLWDQYFYATPHGSWGDPRSTVRFSDFLIEGRLPLQARVEVLDRRGCDTVPVDAASEDGRLTLLSFVWPDQAARIHNLRCALASASVVPAPIDAQDAGRWLEVNLSPRRGSATIVFHSVVWQYLGASGQKRVLEAIERGGAAAGPDAPLAWLRLEQGGQEAEVRLTHWPGARERLVATSGFHGSGVRWLG